MSGKWLAMYAPPSSYCGRISARVSTGSVRKSVVPQLSQNSGFTFIELMVVVVILSVLALFSFVAYTKYVYKAKLVSAIADLTSLEKVIYGYTVDSNEALPPNLTVIGYGDYTDPWGRGYVYQPDLTLSPRIFEGTPINDDYDLYSVGRDGATSPDITSPAGADDIIRAQQGAYKGIASDF